MPRILFLATPEERSVPRGEHYEAGEVYDLTDDQVGRWLRRGIAVDAPPEPKPEPKVEAKAEEKEEPKVERKVSNLPPMRPLPLRAAPDMKPAETKSEPEPAKKP